MQEYIDWCYRTALSHSLTQRQRKRYKPSMTLENGIATLILKDVVGAWSVKKCVSVEELCYTRLGMYDHIAMNAEQMYNNITRNRHATV